MCGESGRSIRAVMGFDVVWRPSRARAEIAKGRLYLRSRFHLRNLQISINRTGVQHYGVDETGQSEPWYTKALIGLSHQRRSAERRFDLWRFGDCAGEIDSVNRADLSRSPRAP